MRNVLLRPRLRADGSPVTLRDPASGELVPPSGQWKPASAFWLKRLRDGDAVALPPVAAAPPAQEVRKRADSAPPRPSKPPGHTPIG